MNKRYYSVELNGASFEVNSLSEVKKLIRNQPDWSVACFTGSVAAGTLKYHGSAWLGVYEVFKKRKWKYIDKKRKIDALCFAIYKSRIAK